ncbi:hypothetical protein D047_4709A, partial [Vibrio parahaemolyticus VPTS-2010_2]
MIASFTCGIKNDP